MNINRHLNKQRLVNGFAIVPPEHHYLHAKRRRGPGAYFAVTAPPATSSPLPKKVPPALNAAVVEKRGQNSHADCPYSFFERQRNVMA